MIASAHASPLLRVCGRTTAVVPTVLPCYHGPMDWNPDELAVFAFISSAPLEDCASPGPRLWSSWRQWLQENPWLASVLHDRLAQEGYDPSQCEQAMTRWLRQSFGGLVSKGHIDLEAGTTYWQVQAIDAFSGEPVVCVLEVGHTAAEDEGHDRLAPPEQECINALRRLEREILICHPDAPVLVATHQPQLESDVEQWPEDVDDYITMSTHLAIESFALAPAATREELMGRDNERSDGLAEDMMAPKRVKEHQGMYSYTSVLVEPAAPLRAMRSSLQLSKTTGPAVQSARCPPRI